MRLDFDCKSISGNPADRDLKFSWDSETGDVSGRDAQQVKAMATWDAVNAHPQPWTWKLRANPLKDWTDMAAIVGSRWVIPPELAEHYPRCDREDEPPDVGYFDERGLYVLGRDGATFCD